eukprot:1320703-Rhodomonas_salina.1
METTCGVLLRAVLSRGAAPSKPTDTRGAAPCDAERGRRRGRGPDVDEDVAEACPARAVGAAREHAGLRGGREVEAQRVVEGGGLRLCRRLRLSRQRLQQHPQRVHLLHLEPAPGPALLSPSSPPARWGGVPAEEGEEGEVLEGLGAEEPRALGHPRPLQPRLPLPRHPEAVLAAQAEEGAEEVDALADLCLSVVLGAHAAGAHLQQLHHHQPRRYHHHQLPSPRPHPPQLSKRLRARCQVRGSG